MTAEPIRAVVCGHDVGGINLLAPLLDAWRERAQIAAAFVGTAATQREMDARLRDATHERLVVDVELLADPPMLDAMLDALLARLRCEAVLTATSRACPLERRLILAATRHAIPTVAFCDMWWAMDARFREPDVLARPDELWLVDDVPPYAEPAPWTAAPALRVIGHPLYAQRIARGWGEAADVHRSARRVLRFLSEPATTHFPQARVDEFAVAERALAALRAHDRATPFVVRTHPAEAIEPWRRWCWARRDDGVALDVEPLDSCFTSTARAIGIASSLLVEMRLASIPTAVLRTPAADPAYYALPFAAMDVALIDGQPALEEWLTRDAPLAVPPAAQRHRDAIVSATESLLAHVRGADASAESQRMRI
jgi:hypothetical protein